MGGSSAIIIILDPPQAARNIAKAKLADAAPLPKQLIIEPP
jgi:hypothetical protein